MVEIKKAEYVKLGGRNLATGTSRFTMKTPEESGALQEG